MRKGKAHIFVITTGQLIGAFLQSLVVDGKTVSFKEKQFNLVTFAVDKNEDVARKYIVLHEGSDHAAQGIEMSSHIGHPGIEKITALGRKVEHTDYSKAFRKSAVGK